MVPSTDERKIEELLTRGVAEVIPIDILRARLRSGERLRVKLGIDPTSPHLHLGRSVPLLKMRDFQELGHHAILIVGDATGVVGDTSDKDSERPMLSQETIDLNKAEYFAQISKIIDLNNAELHHNSEWLDKLTYRDIGEHADLFSVADFISRENIQKRLGAGKRVSLREILYPLMQGYDSVVVRADVELGGTDQKFNVLAGRPLQEHFGQAPQSVVLNPLVPGLDGRKMSSSWGNTINFTDTPTDMYGKIMSIHDHMIIEYFRVFTRVPLDAVEALENELAVGGMHPKEAKMLLAREIVGMYHDGDAAQRAEASFIQTFSRGGVPVDTATIVVTRGTLLIDALVTHGLVTSKTEARRLLQAGAISLPLENDIVLTNPGETVEETRTIRIGKKRFVTFAPTTKRT